MRKVELYQILASAKAIEPEILNVLIEKLRKENIQDCIRFLLIEENQNEMKQIISQKHNLDGKQKLLYLTSLLRQIYEHDFNNTNYSTEIYIEFRNQLTKKIQKEERIIKFLKFLVNLTSVDDKFIPSGSNSLYLLFELKVDLTQQNFENIRIKDIPLIGANFARCNLSGSQFRNVNISGINLNEAQLINCDWKFLKIHQINTLVGHSSVSSVCFSPNGAILMSSSDSYIHLWDVKTGKKHSQLKCLIGGSKLLLSNSPNYCMQVSGYRNQIINVWNINKGKILLRLQDPSGAVRLLSLSPNGTALASVHGINHILFWNLKTRKNKSILNGESGQVYSLCFSPDGNTLLFSIKNIIHLWDVKSEKKTQFVSPTTYVSLICFSPDGNTLASGSGGDQQINLWDVKTLDHKLIIPSYPGRVLSMCFSPDGTTLASLNQQDKSIYLWDAKTGQKKSILKGHSKAVSQICFSYSGILASCSSDKTIHLWDVKAREQKTQLDGHNSGVVQICFSPDFSILASCSEDNSISLWDANTGQKKSQLNGHEKGVISICFSNDGKAIASGSWDETIRFWKVKSGKEKFQLAGHQGGVSALCFSRDGKALVSAGLDSSIRIWNIKTRKEKYLLDEPCEIIKSFYDNPYGHRLESGCWEKSIQKGIILEKTYGHKSEITSLCFSPVENILVSGSKDKTIILWDIQKRTQKMQINGHTDAVQTVCFSPDGTTIASGGNDNSIRLWDIKTGFEQFRLNGHVDLVSSLCFSPDGKILASGSWDNTIRLWDIRTQQEKYQLKGHVNLVHSVRFSNNGTKLASCSKDNSIRLWHIKTEEQFHESDIVYNKILDKLRLPPQDDNLKIFRECVNPVTILLMSQDPIFQAQQAFVFKGEFMSHFNTDLSSIFKLGGSYILESTLKLDTIKKK
ncbi:unnamed protein product [Paramecium octaurelia]|uniref:EML-like second beta-propeller domain-containing protein n=1 Tax=Paramecium octaurelia TaxID=43137 RepID=A0A8S1URM9_PAROT|nr:unnamed protein product [Paramecium octaurelia]